MPMRTGCADWISARRDVWGKLYGQWIAGANVFVYDHEKFTPADILQKIQDYHVTSLCAPPTIFRFLIHEDLTKLVNGVVIDDFAR